MSLYQEFETSQDLELTSGIELMYSGGEIFIVRRAGGANKKFGKEFQKRTKKYGTALKADSQSDKLDDEMNKVLIDVYADTIMIGWSGVTDRDGNDLPYTKENFAMLMNDLPELWRDIREKCMEVSLFKTYLNEEISKNS